MTIIRTMKKKKVGNHIFDMINWKEEERKGLWFVCFCFVSSD